MKIPFRHPQQQGPFFGYQEIGEFKMSDLRPVYDDLAEVWKQAESELCSLRLPCSVWLPEEKKTYSNKSSPCYYAGWIGLDHFGGTWRLRWTMDSPSSDPKLVLEASVEVRVNALYDLPSLYDLVEKAVESKGTEILRAVAFARNFLDARNRKRQSCD